MIKNNLRRKDFRMKRRMFSRLLPVLCMTGLPSAPCCGENADAAFPDGMQMEEHWSLTDTFRRKNGSREDLCLNGLWQFLEMDHRKISDNLPVPPADCGWGIFKVPGAWPNRATGNAQEILNSSRRKRTIADENLKAGWYRRTIRVPENWTNGRILLDAEMVQSAARCFLDGRLCGELYYPGGSLDLSGKLLPGKQHELILLLVAQADENSRKAFMAPGRVVQVRGNMKQRGILGDLWLKYRPRNGEIRDVRIVPNVMKERLLLDVGVTLPRDGRYVFEGIITENRQVVKTFSSPLMTLKKGAQRVSFIENWRAEKLWDLDCPENLCTLELVLKSEDGKEIDRLFPELFGYREFSIAGRDFLLNGKKIHLRSMGVNLTGSGADKASVTQIRRAAEFAKKSGVNHFLPLEYSFLPGGTGYQRTFYEELSRQGLLTSLPLPHASHYGDLSKEENARRYAADAAFQIRKFQNLPSIVLYVANHNFAGGANAQDPERIAGILPDPGLSGNRKQAELSERIIAGIDPARPVNHHAGDLGTIYSINLYPNWAPIQERSDWFGLWEKEGRKPLHLAEYGIPHVANWSSYRGPRFIHTSGDVMHIWYNEYNAAFLGERAYRYSEEKRKFYDLQERLCTGNRETWFWQFAGFLTCDRDADAVRSLYLKQNLPDFRAFGVSFYLLWDWQSFWTRSGSGRKKKNTERLRNLKQPGIVADFFTPGETPYEDAVGSWKLTETGKTVAAQSAPLLGRIVGKEGSFTERSVWCLPGETVGKQIQLLNDSRTDRTFEWSFSVPELSVQRSGSVLVPAGERRDIPQDVQIPSSCGVSSLTLKAEFRSGTYSGKDSFVLRIDNGRYEPIRKTVGLFDPEGSLEVLLKRIGISARKIGKEEELDGIRILILGRNSLPQLSFRLADRIRGGLRVLVMEQSAQILEKYGFRVQEYAVRRVFRPDGSRLENWRGDATLLPPMLSRSERSGFAPTHLWNGHANTRIWRAGNRGAVASVLPEKPQSGNWLPLLSAGFDLQYAPVLEYRNGKGVVLFSQLDICGRTETEPEALRELNRMLVRLDRSSPRSEKSLYHAGGTLGELLLRARNMPFESAERCTDSDGVLVITPEWKLEGNLPEKVRNGLTVLALGLSGEELNRLFPGFFRTQSGKWYAGFAGDMVSTPEFAGITSADLHWRNGWEGDLFLVGSREGRSLKIIRHGKGKIVALQTAPWSFDEEEAQYRTTIRRQNFLVSRLLYNLGVRDRDGFPGVFNPGFRNGGLEILPQNWMAMPDPGKTGREEKLFAANGPPDSRWRKIQVPGEFEKQWKGYENYDGWVWYRLEFELPDSMRSMEEVTLNLGAVDDESWIWLNGLFLGEVSVKTNPENCCQVPRICRIPQAKFRTGKNVLTVLCNDLRGTGGLIGTPYLNVPKYLTLYLDEALESDDPYRYYGW